MKAKVECIPCILRQIIKASSFSKLSDGETEKIVREAMTLLLQERWDKTPPELAHVAHAVVRKHTGGDPYRDVKRESNDIALKMYPDLKRMVEESADPLLTAIRLAIAGNIIDFGAMVEFDLEETVRDVLGKEFRFISYERFTRDLERAKRIIYFFDNAGEIVFDRLLIETILSKHDVEITGVVKAGPIINDATEEDLKYVSLDRLISDVRYLSNGEVGYERNDPIVGRWIREHDLIISKGQGNYEGLSEWKGIYYLLMVKCPVVARDIGAEVGDIIMLYK